MYALAALLHSSFTVAVVCRHVNEATHTQFSQLVSWTEEFKSSLFDILEPERHILFGEWCTIVHSLHYTNLPGYFIAFDLYDRQTERFATRQELHTKLKPYNMPVVPIVAKGTFTDKEDLRALLETKSKYRNNAGTVEGIYLRCEEGNGVVRKCKLVRPDFVQGIEEGGHWFNSNMVKQTVNRSLLQLDCYPEAVDDSADSSAAISPGGGAGGDGNGNAADTVPTSDTLVPLDPRERHTVSVSGADVKLPRNFSFVVTSEWAVSSTPKSRDQVLAFASLGIGLVVTLTEETPLAPQWFEGTGVTNVFVPVPNYHPPSTKQMDQVIVHVQAAVAGGHKAVEHCGGGKGRAGTVAACLLLRFGLDGIVKNSGSQVMCHMSSSEAIAYLRHIRPGSLETKHQEDFVRDYANHLWSQSADVKDDALGNATGGEGADTATSRDCGAVAGEAHADCSTVVGDTNTAAFQTFAVSDQVVEELQALDAIYDGADEYVAVSTNPPICAIRVPSTSGAHAAVIRFAVGPEYPEQRCIITVRDPVAMVPTHLTALHAALVKEAEASTGEPMIYTLADFAKGWIDEHVEKKDAGNSKHNHNGNGHKDCSNRSPIGSACAAKTSKKTPHGSYAPANTHAAESKHVRPPQNTPAVVANTRSFNINATAFVPMARPDVVPPSTGSAVQKITTTAAATSTSTSTAHPSAVAANGTAAKAGSQKPVSKKAKKEAAAVAALQKASMKRAPDIIMLVGIPGSGKSTFGQVLAQAGWHRISQDDHGKKRATSMAGAESKIGKRCLLDRCNVEVQERRTWLGLMHNPSPKRTAAVHFNVAANECVRRVFQRQGHPTIKAGTDGSQRIVRGFAKRLVPPTKAEGFGHIYTVSTFADVKKLLQQFGVPEELIATVASCSGSSSNEIELGQAATLQPVNPAQQDMLRQAVRQFDEARPPQLDGKPTPKQLATRQQHAQQVKEWINSLPPNEQAFVRRQQRKNKPGCHSAGKTGVRGESGAESSNGTPKSGRTGNGNVTPKSGRKGRK